MWKFSFLFVSLLMLFSTSLYADYKYMGSFKAGESISGQRSSQKNYTGLEYDFVVEEYGIVEFKPQEPTNNTAQYKIRDAQQHSTAGYFYVGGAEGITSHGSLDYPDGWKIGMMPGTYKIIVYTGYYEDNPETTFSMTTSITPLSSSYQSPKTGTTLNSYSNGDIFHTPTPIALNTTIYDNLSFYSANSEALGTGYIYKNDNDFFSFSLDKESDLNITLDIEYANTLSLFVLREDGNNACASMYNFKTNEVASSTCTLQAGNYTVRVQGGSDYNLYSFKIATGESCPTFYLEKSEQQIALKVGDVDYLNIKVCDPVSIQSSDESVLLAARSQSANVNEVKLQAISNGTATVTVSDSSGSVGHLYVTVGDGVATPITTPDTKQEIGNITFLEYEPDGYFSWSEADKFCKERGYRLPTMDELIYVWNLNGGNISPLGFQKDTFYWSGEVSEKVADSYQACAMDADCSQEEAWPADSNGHPKCVVSVNGSLDTDTPDNPALPNEISSAKYSDFTTQYCGAYTTTTEGLKVEGTSYRYGNNLRSVKTYDVRDSVTKMKWKAQSNIYSAFTPTLVNITGGYMTTDHSFAGSVKIESDTWYYTTMSVSGTKATTVTAKNAYATSGSDVIDSREHELSEAKLELSKNGLEIGFNMGDTYASTDASFTIAEFGTNAKVVTKNIEKNIVFEGAISDKFSAIVGEWKFVDNQLQIVEAKLNDRVILAISNASGVRFKVLSKQDQSNFVIRALDSAGNIISAVTVDPSINGCTHEYYLPTTKEVTEIEFLFTKDYAIEHYESQYKDISITDLRVEYSSDEKPSSVDTGYTIVDFEVIDNGDAQEIKVDMGDKTPTLTVPPSSDVFQNNNGGITTITPESFDIKTMTTLNSNGTFMSEIEKLLGEIEERTRVLIDLVIEYATVNSDGSNNVRATFENFILNLTTDTSTRVTPNYSIGGKEIKMPTFNSGSRVYVTTYSNDVIIEVQTKLTSKIVFER